ncbi:MAG: ribonuclease HI [Candidatus Heimdallarchaeota archaeon]
MSAVATRINTDGASRGNPGPSAVGYTLQYGGVTVKDGRRIPDGTNNEAELWAVLAALRSVEETPQVRTGNYIVYCDSQYVVNVLNGTWAPRANRELIDGVEHLKHRIGGDWTFKWIPREENQMADELANRALDQSIKRSTTKMQNGNSNGKGPLAKDKIKVSTAGWVDVTAWDKGKYPASVRIEKTFYNKVSTKYESAGKFSIPPGQLNNVISSLQKVRDELVRKGIKTDAPEVASRNGNDEAATKPTSQPREPQPGPSVDPALIAQITEQVLQQLAKQG